MADPAAIAALVAANEAAVNTVLQYIGFNATEIVRVGNEIERDAGLICFSVYDGKRVKELVTDLKEKPAASRVHIGARRTERIRAVAHWVKDQQRINTTPSVTGITQAEFLIAINLSAERARMREAGREANEALAKDAAPGMLTGEKAWTKWISALENQLGMILGVKDVPLLYVIRELETPEANATFSTFEEECIARCPLTGPAFEQDAKTVHQIVVSYTTGENAEQWIKGAKRAKNGRTDVITLRGHHAGQGNQTRRIADAERMEKTLFYKDERSMTFANFLGKMQTMFNIYDEVDEPKTDAAKLRMLLDKIQSNGLQGHVQTVRTAVAANPAAFDFEAAANFLGSLVDTVSRAGRGIHEIAVDHDPAIMKDGKINTGFINNWWQLTPAQRKLVEAERDRLGVKPPPKNKKQGGNKNGGFKAHKKQVNKIKKLQRQVKALKRAQTDDTESLSDDDDDESNNPNQAGTQFGGRSEHRKKKAKKARG